VGSTLPAHAQRALQATRVAPSAVPEPLLTLRPQPDLRRLAEEAAEVLELRTGQRVEVGSPPPPGLLEAVPSGHVAMARQGESVTLVLGAPGGRSFDATVRLTGPISNGSDARAIALAAEALSDAAHDTARLPDPPKAEDADNDLNSDSLTIERDMAARDARADAAELPHAASSQSTAMPARASDRDDGELLPPPPRTSLLGNVQPLLYARVYAGGSTASTSPMAGVGGGIGLCVQRQCLFLAGEMPLDTGSAVAQHLDVRYRYPTFVSGFYTRPFSFGPLTPGASIGFLTRLGHFQADMGYRDTGLDTDLGARGSLELAWAIVRGLDLMGEAGVDLTLDRASVSNNADEVRKRGDLWSPWGQLALRYGL
jgi:hypothetical protein